MSIRDPWSELVSEEDVLDLHAEAIRLHGGDGSPPHAGCVDRSLGAAWTAEGYSETDNSKPGLCFAACLLFYLVKNHCFIDGNKRAAWAASMEALRSLGLTIKATDDEAEDYCKSIIAHEVQRATDVISWFAPRLEEYSDI